MSDPLDELPDAELEELVREAVAEVDLQAIFASMSDTFVVKLAADTGVLLGARSEERIRRFMLKALAARMVREVATL